MPKDNLHNLSKSELIKIIHKKNKYIKKLKRQINDLNNTNSKQKDNKTSIKKESPPCLALVPVNNSIIPYKRNLFYEFKKLLLAFFSAICNVYSKFTKDLKKHRDVINFTRSFVYICILVVAITIIFATRVFNVLQVSGDSMEPTLKSGDILISYRFSKIERNDIIAFYYDDNVLIKRVIAVGGDNVFIDDQGNVYVNSEKIDEPYIQNKSYGNCDVTFPIRVPDNEYFVLGDNREISVDSREKNIGTINKDKILGKIL